MITIHLNHFKQHALLTSDAIEGPEELMIPFKALIIPLIGAIDNQLLIQGQYAFYTINNLLPYQKITHIFYYIAPNIAYLFYRISQEIKAKTTIEYRALNVLKKYRLFGLQLCLFVKAHNKTTSITNAITTLWFDIQQQHPTVNQNGIIKWITLIQQRHLNPHKTCQNILWLPNNLTPIHVIQHWIQTHTVNNNESKIKKHSLLFYYPNYVQLAITTPFYFLSQVPNACIFLKPQSKNYKQQEKNTPPFHFKYQPKKNALLSEEHSLMKIENKS